MASTLTPEEIESWITEHPDWLKSYVTHKLDPNLVYRWLLSRDHNRVVRVPSMSNGSAHHHQHTTSHQPCSGNDHNSSHETSPNVSPNQNNENVTAGKDSRSFFPGEREQRLSGSCRKGCEDGYSSDCSGLSPKLFGHAGDSGGSSGGGMTFCESRSGNQRSNSKKYLRQNFARSRIRGLLKAHEPSVSFETDSTLAERRNSLKIMRKCLSLPSAVAGTTLSQLIQSKVRMPRRYASKNEDLKRQLRLQDIRDFFLEIVRDISNDLDLQSLIGSILVNVSILVLAESSSLFFVEGPANGSAVGRGQQILVSRTFDVYTGGGDQLTVRHHVASGGGAGGDQNTSTGASPWGTGIVGHVAETKTKINLRNPMQDTRYREDVSRLSRRAAASNSATHPSSDSASTSGEGGGAGSGNGGAGGGVLRAPAGSAMTDTHSNTSDDVSPLVRPAVCLLCLPICNTDGEVVAVAQVVNKTSTDNTQEFTEDDEKMLETYLAFCGMAISNAQAIDAYRREYDRNKALLEVVHDLFEQQTSVNAVVTKIMQRAQTLLNCERCVVMLEERTTSDSSNKFSEPCRLFDLQQPKTGQLQATSSSSVFYLDASSSDRITPSTDEMINLSDQQLESIYAAAHDLVGCNASGILCKPIRNSKFQTIGAAQLINKLEGGQFDENDERLFEAFTIFCGLGINNCMMYDETARAAAKQAVSLEVLSYHATVPPEQVLLFKNSLVPSVNEWKIERLDFDDFSLSSDEMVLAGIRIFQDMEFIKTFKIEYETLVRWLLTVRKNYRNVAYHNWRHAFNVSQFMFAVLKTIGMRRFFSEIECLALIVAALCHDLDHRGTNNAFQQKSGSALSQLYGTQATLEYHHFNHAVMILNSEGHNIFANLNSEEYCNVMNLLKQAILATDLSLHIQVRQKFFELTSRDAKSPGGSEVCWDDPVNRDVLRSILMTTCDIAAITKPWDIQLQAADLVIMEFFDQGDKEKAVLKIKPLAIMDRERQEELPLLQIEWIDGICLPLYTSLAQMDTKIQPLLNNVIANRERWRVLHANLDKHLKQTEV